MSTHAVFSRVFWPSSVLPPLPEEADAGSLIPSRSRIDMGGVVDTMDNCQEIPR